MRRVWQQISINPDIVHTLPNNLSGWRRKVPSSATITSALLIARATAARICYLFSSRRTFDIRGEKRIDM
jgi:hypothetical protein